MGPPSQCCLIFRRAYPPKYRPFINAIGIAMAPKMFIFCFRSSFPFVLRYLVKRYPSFDNSLCCSQKNYCRFSISYYAKKGKKTETYSGCIFNQTTVFLKKFQQLAAFQLKLYLHNPQISFLYKNYYLYMVNEENFSISIMGHSHLSKEVRLYEFISMG